MMKTVLESAHKQFTKHSAEQKAIEHKLLLVDRDSVYMAFIDTLKRRSFGKTLHVAIKAPWILPMFFWRALEDVFYHTHRMYHGAKARGQR